MTFGPGSRNLGPREPRNSQALEAAEKQMAQLLNPEWPKRWLVLCRSWTWAGSGDSRSQDHHRAGQGSSHALGSLDLGHYQAAELI